MVVFSSINFKFALNPSTRIDNRRVEAFSSSFLSQVPVSKFSYALPPPPSGPPLLHISAAGLEDKQTLLTTETRLPKYQNPPPNTKSTHANKATSLATRTFNVLDEISNNFINRPLKQSVDPHHVLSNNYAPVDELPPTECEVVYGTLPACLNGVYIRNGPNPQFIPHGPYHLFDGDGMLHAITISRGRATLCSRYVKTYKYTVENEAGSPFIPSVFSTFSSGLMASAVRVVVTAARALARQFDSSKGIGTANTSLALIGGKLFALVECDKPYAIKVLSDGDVATLGRHDFDGKLVKNMTAHPKIDLDTGETFAFRCNIMPPFLAYFRFTEKGEKEMDVPIFSITRLPLLHDFAITKKYAIFVETQTEMNLMKMTTGGLPMALDPKKVPRIGIIPRYAEDESEMKWFEVPGYNIIHAINAWDEDNGDTVVLVAPNILSVEHMLERLHLSHALVEKVRIDLKTGMVTRLPLAVRNLEFGVINPKFVGKKSRYIYAAIGGPHLKVIGVVKMDISVSESDGCDCTVGCRMFGPGCYGGEPYFVAKDPNNSKADEDDGYVITYVHNENSRESQFLVMDAKSPKLDIVAAVKLPRRVPCGFHGLFVHKSDLSKL